MAEKKTIGQMKRRSRAKKPSRHAEEATEDTCFVTLFQLPEVEWLPKERVQEMCSTTMEKLEELKSKRAKENARNSADTINRLLLDGKTKEQVSCIMARGRRLVDNWQQPIVAVQANTWTSILVVLQWLLGNTQEAEETARSLREDNPHSPLALSTLYYVLQSSDSKDSKTVLNTLQGLRRTHLYAFEVIFDEEKAELGCCSIELGPEFAETANTILETTVETHPDWFYYKFLLAKKKNKFIKKNLIKWITAGKGTSECLLGALNHLIELLDVSLKTSRDPRMIVSVYAEIGELLDLCQTYQEHYRLSDLSDVLQRAQERKLSASKCFQMVMRSDDLNPSILIQVGKYFRNAGNLGLSYRALQRALERRETAKAHYQFALVLRKKAIEVKWKRQPQRLKQQPGKGNKRGRGRGGGGGGREGPRAEVDDSEMGTIRRADICKFNNRPDFRMAKMERYLKTRIHPEDSLWSRRDEYVNQMIDHLRKAQLRSNGCKIEVNYDLGLTFKHLGEYKEALEEFTKILDLDRHPTDVVRALEQCGQVFFEQCKKEASARAKQELYKEGVVLFNMTLLHQAKLVKCRRQRKPLALEPWRSITSLRRYLSESRTRDGSKLTTNDEAELWLLRLMWMYAETLPVLKDMQTNTSWSAETWADHLHGILHQRMESSYSLTDLLVLDSLLGLLTEERDIVDRQETMAFICMREAISRLLENVRHKVNLCSPSLNRSLAHRLFRWVFAEKVDVSLPQGMEDSLLYHVVIIHVYRDQDSALLLQSMLEDVFGLIVLCLESEDKGIQQTEIAIANAARTLFICSPGENSPDYETCVRKAASSTKNKVKIVTLEETTTLPVASGNWKYETFWLKPELAEQAGSNGLSTVTDVDSLLQLFTFLADVQ